MLLGSTSRVSPDLPTSGEEFMEKALLFDHYTSRSGSLKNTPEIQLRLDGIINNFMNRQPTKVVSIKAITEKSCSRVAQTHIPESELISQDSFKKSRKFWMAKVSD